MSDFYFILRWRGGSLQKDECLSASENLVRIGQKEDCDVRLPNEGVYEDELFAIIKPTRSADGWQIIPLSEHVQTFINGTPAGITHYLENGDRISFSETGAEISFERRYDKNHGAETLHFTGISRRMTSFLGVAAAIVLALIFLAIAWPSIDKKRNNAALREAEASMRLIQVDSIYLVRQTADGEEVIRRGSAVQRGGLVVQGAAFLTTEGRLVTARHCIEPWLNFKQLYDSAAFPTAVAWAMEAETFNQTHRGDTLLRLVSRCTVSLASGQEERTFLSSEFQYNDTRDELVELGDYYTVRYWRSVTGRFNRSDMMLGDIAVADNYGIQGTICPATEKQLRKWLTAGERLLFMGFPRRVESGLDQTPGELSRDYRPGHMIQHNGSLDPGYSGGPALVAKGGKAYVTGVVSTFEADSKNCIYSVPVTELETLTSAP